MDHAVLTRALLVLPILGLTACHRGHTGGIGSTCDLDRIPCRGFLTCVAGRCASQAEDAHPHTGPGADMAMPSTGDGGTDGTPDSRGEDDAAFDGPTDLPPAPGQATESSPGRPWPGGLARYCWEVVPTTDEREGRTTAVSPSEQLLLGSLLEGFVADAIGRVGAVRLQDAGACAGRTAQENSGLITIATRVGPISADLGHLASRATRIRVNPASPRLREDLLSVVARALGVPGPWPQSPLGGAQFATLRELYGPRPRGSVVGWASRCLDVFNGMAVAGTPLQVFECHGDQNQLWKWGLGGSLLVNLGAVMMCLDAPGARNAEGSLPVELRHCDGGPDQRLKFTWTRIKGAAGRCLRAPTLADGAGLALGECDLSVSPPPSGLAWDLLPSHGARVSDSNLCLAPPAAGPSPHLRPCDAVALDGWQAFGRSAEGVCLQAQGEMDAPTLGWGSCSREPRDLYRQTFQTSGTIQTQSGFCLDLQNANPGNHVLLQQRPCASGATTLLWDFVL